MHLNSINVDCMSITELEALHKANAKRPTQVPLSALRTATQYFQAKDGVIRGDIVQSLCTSLSRAPETTLRGLEPLFVFGSEDEPIIVDGHHRLEALHYFFQETEGDPKVNVQWIEGGYLDAQRSVISSNSIARTNLTPKQRTQQAWQQHVLLLKQGVLLEDWRSNARSNWRFTKEQAKEKERRQQKRLLRRKRLGCQRPSPRSERETVCSSSSWRKRSSCGRIRLCSTRIRWRSCSRRSRIRSSCKNP